MKVRRIIDSQYKTGEKNGKKWALMKIEVEGGKEATGFGPVTEGDEVDLTYNEQYKNYSFKVLNPQEIPSRDINDDISGSAGSDNTSSATPAIKEVPPPAADSKYLKDISDTPKDIFKALLPYVDSVKLISSEDYTDKVISRAFYVADKLLERMNNIRNGKPLKGIEKARQTRKDLDIIDTADSMFPDEE